MFDMLFRLEVNLCAVRDEPALGPVVDSLVTAERRREAMKFEPELVTCDDGDDLFRRLSFGAGTARVVRLSSGCCCCWMVEVNVQPLVFRGSDMIISGDELMDVL